MADRDFPGSATGHCCTMASRRFIDEAFMNGPASQSATSSFLTLREDMARVLGLQTVDLLIDRGVTEIAEAYPVVKAVSVVGGELNVASLEDAFFNSSADEANAALSALTAVMLLIMARLLGKRVADSIADSLDKASLLKTVRM